MERPVENIWWTLATVRSFDIHLKFMFKVRTRTVVLLRAIGGTCMTIVVVQVCLRVFNRLHSGYKIRVNT